jgi:D-serine deaminase-like pyridoxal phosphate-dependent protein
MIDYDRIKKPTLLLDETKCRQNIRTMTVKAKASEVIFRPHFKTHQSVTIGKWFREEGVSIITVSSVTMAKHFAFHGWDDVTIAFPVNLRELDEIGILADNISLNILVSGWEQTKYLIQHSKSELGCFIKINTGLNRSGIDWDDFDQVGRIVDQINNSPNIRFKGFLTHSGHTYKATEVNEITDIYHDTLYKLSSLRSRYSSFDIILSTGDTPSCSVVNDFKGFDEIRPGNFVFYDLTQVKLGSCKPSQVAVAVACPVVEKNHKRKEIIIYGGGVHLSKESLKLADGRTVFGEAVIIHDRGWSFPDESCFVKSLSQEHGIISSSTELMRITEIGTLIGIIPVHSCMTADLMREYYTLDNKRITDFSPK